MQIMTECSELIRCISPPWLCREITRRTPMCIGIPKARDIWLMFMKTTWFYADVILLKISSCLWRYIVLIQHLLRSRRDRISIARAFCFESLRGILFKKEKAIRFLLFVSWKLSWKLLCKKCLKYAENILRKRIKKRNKKRRKPLQFKEKRAFASVLLTNARWWKRGESPFAFKAYRFAPHARAFSLTPLWRDRFSKPSVLVR